jgi:NAD(P)-dependent dehydrogenase (short-subunit alcohol dehydrogenase family)
VSAGVPLDIQYPILSDPSSSGLGLATTYDLLALPDVYISIVDRSPPPADLLSNANVRYFDTDITKVDQIERAVEATVDWTKETHALLGGVVNCAGVGVVSKVFLHSSCLGSIADLVSP